jgi:sugar/nucleoside kinase (ribokinase family)
MKTVLAVGTAGKDEHIKIDSVDDLPAPFKRYLRRTLPLSRISEFYGEGWSAEMVFDALRRRSVAPIHYSYGGRAPHIAYGLALLGGRAVLATSFGDDCDEPYPGFFGGGYLSHLERAGVRISALRLSLPYDKWNYEAAPRYLLENYGDHLLRSSAVVVEGKKTSTITCVKDLKGIDFFFLDDVNGAATIERWRPMPTDVVRDSDIVFVTSSEREFMQQAVDQGNLHGKTVVVDIASYGVTPEYLRYITPRSDVLLGNESEVRQVLDAYEIRNVGDIFEAHGELPTHVVVEDKYNGTVDVYARRGRTKQRIGPVKIRKSGNSTGVCDAIATGVLASLQRELTLADGAAVGLIEGASVWEVEGVQEGMLNREDLLRRLGEEFTSLQAELVKRIRKNFS